MTGWLGEPLMLGGVEYRRRSDGVWCSSTGTPVPIDMHHALTETERLKSAAASDRAALDQLAAMHDATCGWFRAEVSRYRDSMSEVQTWLTDWVFTGEDRFSGECSTCEGTGTSPAGESETCGDCNGWGKDGLEVYAGWLDVGEMPQVVRALIEAGDQ